jgi:RNA polymerase sigma-70 factor (ECF subfamily)
VADLAWIQVVNQERADFAQEDNQAAGGHPTESSIVGSFLAELGRLKRIVAGMGLSVSDAEDVLQDVSVEALKRPGRGRSQQQNRRWLMKVTINRCLLEHRRGKTFRRRAVEILQRRLRSESDSMDGNAIAAEELEVVRKTLHQLDGSLLMPMVLRYFCDLNSTEIAEILSLSPSTLRSRLRQGRLTLAKQLIARGVEP